MKMHTEIKTMLLGWTQVSLFTPCLLQHLMCLTESHFTRENPLQGDASRTPHLAVIYYVLMSE